MFVARPNGFIGSRVVRLRHEAGHDDVCLLRRTSRTARLDGVHYSRVEGDVRSAESLRAALRSCEATLHLAAPGGWEADEPALLTEVIARGIIAAIHAGRAGERYILGGENLSIRQLAELVLEPGGGRALVLSVLRGLARGLARIAVRTRVPMPFDPHVVPYATRYWFVESANARRELGAGFRSARETIGETPGWLRTTGR